MSSRFLLAVVASSITVMMVGFLLYGVLFVDLFREGASTLPGVMKAKPDIAWILVGQLGFGVLVTLVVSWRGALSLTGGLHTGLVFGFLMAVGVDCPVRHLKPLESPGYLTGPADNCGLSGRRWGDQWLGSGA